MPVTHKNLVSVAVSSVASAGLGTFTVGAATSGALGFVAGDDGKSFDARIWEGTASEVRRDCVYTHSGTTLSRGTLESSTTGSAIAFTTAAVIEVTQTAYTGNRIEAALQSLIPGGRLTLTTGVPVTTSDVTGATSVYYTPYLHNVVVLWDGAKWVPVVFTEQTLALGTVTSGAEYDVYGYLSAGALALEKAAWSNSTTPTWSMQDGRKCKIGDKTRLRLGGFRSTSTTTTEDSGGGTTSQVGGKRLLWNEYNRVRRHLAVIDTTDSWNYLTDTVRQANAASGNKVEFFAGSAEDSVSATVYGVVYIGGLNETRAAKVGIGVDSTTAMSGIRQGGYLTYINNTASSNGYAPITGTYRGIPGVGYHYLAWLEKGAALASTFLGDNGGDGQQTGLMAEVMA